MTLRYPKNEGELTCKGCGEPMPEAKRGIPCAEVWHRACYLAPRVVSVESWPTGADPRFNAN